MFKQILGTAFFLSIGFFAMAQDPDTLVRKKADTIIAAPKQVDTVARRFTPKLKKEKVYHPDSTHIPSVAVKRSLIIPGLGQIYNRKYWKVPIIYGGLGLLASAIIFNQRYFKEFLALARIKSLGRLPVQGDPEYASYIKYKTQYDLYSTQSLDFFSNASYAYQRNRDLSILGVLGLWGIQAIDAYIDAKFLSSFTVDNDLSMKVAPSLINQPAYAMANVSNAYIPGIKITFTLK
ncbi:MAG: hypothetical protein JWR05_1339 [Mucilaginibacter sp.]|jgi:hypothetical protein|nr:hypothetical protein [Mucilaginibacter sp.]